VQVPRDAGTRQKYSLTTYKSSMALAPFPLDLLVFFTWMTTLGIQNYASGNPRPQTPKEVYPYEIIADVIRTPD
jgi:hypothetical protein